ncbi:MAG: hypothetical protein V1758_08965 [Pseudomonadota bacterium]
MDLISDGTCSCPSRRHKAFDIMILILDLAAMEGVAGVARYRDEFSEAM